MIQDVVNRSRPLPSGSKLLILGAGFSGQHIAAIAKELGTQVICSRREMSKTGADFIFDSSSEELPSKEFLEGTTHLLSSIPPNINGEDPVLLKLKNQLEHLPLKWVGYLSTTGVYGDSKGNWVAETDHPKPQQPRSKRRLACEHAWQATDLPVQIIRLPGIYGPGRSAITNIKNGKINMIDKPGQVFSRVHIDDIAGSIMHLINLYDSSKRPAIINLSDNLPTSNLKVIQYAAQLLNYSLPPIETYEIASKKMSAMAISFWEENRKVSNKLLCNELGYSLIHPDYESGLKDCLKYSE